MKPRRYLRGIASLVFAGLFTWFGWQFREYGLKLGWEPHKLSAAELVANGPGDNLKVELTDCHIGEPVVETFKDSVTNAWFPVYVQLPANLAKTKEIPPIFFHRAAGDTRLEFDAWRRQLVVSGVVASEFAVFADGPTDFLRQAYPGLDQAKVIFIRSSSIPLQGLVYIAWTGATLFGLFGLFRLVGPRRAEFAPAASTAARAPTAWASFRHRQSTDVVPLYHAAPGTIPPEIEALGKPDHVHPPTWIYTAGKRNSVLVAIGGLVLLGIGLLLVMTLPLAGNGILMSIVALIIMAGIGLTALPFAPFDYVQTYLVYPDALVIVEKDTFAVIRWDVLKELNAGRVLVTADRQLFGLFTLNGIVDEGRLYDRVQAELTHRLLPPALAALEAGETLPFGPFTVSRMAIGHEGTTLSWEQIGRIRIVSFQGLRQLALQEKGRMLGDLWRGNLAAAPNDWLLLELVRRVCPPQLLSTSKT